MSLMVQIAAVIFDMDGTITRPRLDFDAIRAEIGDIDGPILEAMQKMTPNQRQRAEEILDQHEIEAAENAELNPNVHEVFDWLRERNRAIGLVTRNRRQNVAKVCQIHNLSLDSVVTREDGPAKPDPFAVFRTCQTLGVEPSDTLVVGDYLFDLVSGREAGAQSVLLASQQNHTDFHHEADYVITDLGQLPQIICQIEQARDETP